VFLIVGALLIALAFIRYDLDAFREPLTEAATQAAERPVEIGGLSLRFLPLPYVEVRDLVIAGEGDAPPLARVGRIDVRPHVWPLLTRRQYVATVEIRAPVVHLEPDAKALPPIPVPGEIAPPSTGDAAEAGEEPLPFVLRSVRITDGVIEWGDVRAQSVSASGSLGEDGRALIDLDADIPGVADLRDVHVRYGPIGDERPATEATGRLVDADLGAVGRAFLDRDDLTGSVTGTFEVALDGDEPTRIRVDAEADEVGVGDLELRLDGKLDLEASAGGPLRADLTPLTLAMGQILQKRAGEKLTVSGTLPDRPTAQKFDDVLVELEGTTLPLQIDLSGPSPRITVGATEISLGALARLQPEPLAIRGTVSIEDRVSVALDPLEIRGQVVLDVDELSLRAGNVQVDGRIEGRGTQISSRDLRLNVWEQPFAFATSYRLDNGQLVVDGGTEGADLLTLGRAFLGRDELSGTLRTKGVIRTSVPSEDPVRATRADVRIDVTDGEIRGFSLTEEILGELAAVPLLVAALKGKDFSRYEEEEFEELSGDFRLRDGVLRTDNLTVRYRYATAQLRGSVTVPKGELDLSGKVTLSREVDSDLGGEERARERVIPIAGIRGTVTKPRVELDDSALVAIAQAYTGQDRVREKLEEKLGPGGAEAVESILEQLMRRRGGQK
jgi:hypothetical protein